MSDEVKRAAERLRRIANGEPSQSVYEYVPVQLPAGGFMVPGSALHRWEEDRRVIERAYLAEHPADEDEPADIDWLLDSGGDWSTDGTAIVLNAKGPGPEIVFGVNRRSGEEYVGSLGLHWSYAGEPKVGLAYLIEDDPTRGQARRLCTALGIELKRMREE